jgi:phosphoribosyl 1,2-cyclic phosphodiesterase
MKYAVLGSGSSANAYIFEQDDFAFIIDNGFSCREFLRRTQELGFDVEKIKLIFITHVHRDHINGVGTLARRLKVPVVRHNDLNLTGYIRGLKGKELAVLPGVEYNYDRLRFIPFPTHHDAPFSISYHFILDQVAFTVATDTGIVTPELLHYAAQAEVLFLEANYNEQMLLTGPYPQHLKKRILSQWGHLSNKDAINLLNTLTSRPASRLKLVYLCHLSETNNSPEQLAADLTAGLTCSGTYVVCRRSSMHPGLDPGGLERWQPLN